MSLLKFYDYLPAPIETPIEEQDTVRMAAVTTCLPVVAQSLVRDTPLPEPIIYNAPHHPVYRVYIDGKMRPMTRDINGVDLLVGRALRQGAHSIEVYEDEVRLYEVNNP